MKTCCVLLCVLFSVNFCASENIPVLSKSNLLTQEIRYLTPEASNVYIVWGVNNWNIPSKELLPEGSYIKDHLVYTPMNKQSYGFVSEINVPVNTVIDYVFWITEGPAQKPVNVWDINSAPNKDYHTKVVTNNIVFINSVVNVRPKAALSVLDFSLLIFSFSIILFFLALLLIRFLHKIRVTYSPVKIIISTAFVLIINLILLRTSVTGMSWDLYLHPLSFLLKVMWAGFYDVVYVLVLMGVFLLLLKIAEAKKSISLFFTWLFVIVSFSSLVAGILNIRVVETIGQPFDYPWFYYSDFLKSADSHAALSSNISTEYILQLLMICLSAIFSCIVVIILGDLFLQKFPMKKLLSFSLSGCCIIYLVIAFPSLKHYNWSYEKLANPIVAFGESINPLAKQTELFTMKIADSLRFEQPQPNNKINSLKINSNIKNVILFVMESTPAEYVQPYATEYKVTPELEKHLSHSVIFDNIYAHAPATNNSMVSILASIYPWISYNCITKEHPDISIPTLSSELKKHGYRTAFFNSADNRYQKADEFLAKRKFDEIKDCSALSCGDYFEVKDEKSAFMNGKDDECTANDLSGWIKKNRTSPFFVMMWTYQTHYPYFVSGPEKTYNSSDPIFNRYLNAVNHSDQALGKILEELERNNLSESTLVVVVGDHGEAFGRHDQIVHAAGIYEENLHVPCILINPSFKGQHNSAAGGLVDIAPTIMNQLGYTAAPVWQGKNLFTKEENDRVYFFTPWADYLFGYREGNKKFIFNATKNLTEVYDLKNDPFETKNLALDYSENVNISHQRIAGWVQYLNRYQRFLFAKKK
jgi:lipoteichoic acid synthase